MYELQEFMKDTVKFKTYKMNNGQTFTMQELRPRIFCNNGVSLSVQASELHYCEPRFSGNLKYDCVEVGYPSINPPESWIEYQEDSERDPKDTIYPYIPVGLVEKWINENGGIDREKTLACENN